MARQVRVPVYAAITMVALVALVLPITLQFPMPAIVGGCLLVGFLILSYRGEDDRSTRSRYAAHGAYFFSLAVVAYAVFGLGVSPVITAYAPSGILLAAAHLLGTRAAILWSLPTLALISAAVIYPPAEVRDLPPAVMLVARNGAMLMTLAFAVAFRQSYDRQSARMQRSETTDPLTGLSNRRALNTAITEALGRSLRFGRRGALLWIDVDGLKAVNDRLGHEAGDELIRVVADRIASSIRGVDTAARVGGDEFVVLLSEFDDVDGAQIFSHRLLQKLLAPCDVGEETINPSASIGVAHFPPNEEPDVIMHRADDAMYQAKRSGGGRIVFC